jgi:hypothetical protein
LDPVAAPWYHPCGGVVWPSVVDVVAFYVMKPGELIPPILAVVPP